MHRFLGRITFVAMLVLPSAAVLSAEDGHRLSLWQVEGQQNRVYLLGSIHLLREQDHPLPSAIYAAYEDADKLIMELDMDDVDPLEGQALTQELGLIRDGRSLSDLMGAAPYAEAERLAANLQVPLELLASAEPWYAAINVELMLLMRIGFDPELGIESHLANIAQADSKEILGLETMRQQLELLDGLSPQAQRDMLLQALAEGVEMDAMMDSMITAWRHGDTGFLQESLLSDMQDHVELNRVIVLERNRAWSSYIEELLDDPVDYLIVVGTLHLVGDAGVPKLLEARGREVTQLQQPPN